MKFLILFSMYILLFVLFIIFFMIAALLFLQYYESVLNVIRRLKERKKNGRV